MNIAGRFYKIPENQKKTPDNKTVVGFIGTVTPQGLNSKNIEHIKTFYKQSGKSHIFVTHYPVTINQNHYNGFMIIE